jgi:hypothetical protein
VQRKTKRKKGKEQAPVARPNHPFTKEQMVRGFLGYELERKVLDFDLSSLDFLSFLLSSNYKNFVLPFVLSLSKPRLHWPSV